MSREKNTSYDKKTPILISDTPLDSFDKVSIDFVGPLRTTARNNRYMLTMQCHLTKYIIAVPLSNMRTTTVADVLAKHLICQFGAPRAILSDNGKNFLADVVQGLLHILRIKHLLTSTYKPETNGMLERSYATLFKERLY